MTAYYVMLLSWVVYAATLETTFKKRISPSNNLWAFLPFFSLLSLIGLRHANVGTDTPGYQNEFNHADEFRFSEFGYSYFNHTFNTLGFSFQLYLIVIALISVGSVA